MGYWKETKETSYDRETGVSYSYVVSREWIADDSAFQFVLERRPFSEQDRIAVCGEAVGDAYVAAAVRVWIASKVRAMFTTDGLYIPVGGSLTRLDMFIDTPENRDFCAKFGVEVFRVSEDYDAWDWKIPHIEVVSETSASYAYMREEEVATEFVANGEPVSEENENNLPSFGVSQGVSQFIADNSSKAMFGFETESVRDSELSRLNNLWDKYIYEVSARLTTKQRLSKESSALKADIWLEIFGFENINL